MASLHASAVYGDANLTQALLDDGHNVDALHPLVGTPLRAAASYGFHSVAEVIISGGADVNHTTAGGRTILFAVIFELSRNNDDGDCLSGINPDRAGLLPVVKLLLENGARPDIAMREPLGLTSLHLSVAYGNASLVKLLLEHGADPNIKKDIGSTPLHLAVALNRSTEVIQELLKAGADVNAINSDGRSPLLIAISNGYEESFRMLLSGDPDLTMKNSRGSTLIHAAVLSQNNNILSTLLQEIQNLQKRQDEPYPVGVNGGNGIGETPLHIAAAKGFGLMARTLVDHGADVNLRDSASSTPLIGAMTGEHDEMMEFLISHGADPSVSREFQFFKHRGGKTAIMHNGEGAPMDISEFRRLLNDEEWEECVDGHSVRFVDGLLRRRQLEKI